MKTIPKWLLEHVLKEEGLQSKQYAESINNSIYYKKMLSSLESVQLCADFMTSFHGILELLMKIIYDSRKLMEKTSME